MIASLMIVFGLTTFQTRAVTYCHTGTIQMFFGYPKDVPLGWQICDGSGPTPDLRGRFAMGAVPGYKTAYKPLSYSPSSATYDGKDNGPPGYDDYKTTIKIGVNNLPMHKHDLDLSTQAGTAHTHPFSGSDSYTPNPHDHTTTGTGTGPLTPHSHPDNFAVMADSGKHPHTIPTQYTHYDGAHTHKQKIFWPEGKDTGYGDKDDSIAVDCVDKSEVEYVYTETDYSDHKHYIPEQILANGGGHDHPLSGGVQNSIGGTVTTGVTGTTDTWQPEDVDITIGGTTGADSPHTHPVTGMTEKTGEGDPLMFKTLPPYVAVHYICCTNAGISYYN